MVAHPHIIVLGNEKGGTGKSTMAMHVIASLLHLGFKVGSIDVDARQGSLTRYIENRRARALTHPEEALLIPDHIPLFRSTKEIVAEAEEEDKDNFEKCLETLGDKEFIVVDTPGSDTYLSRFAHSHADTLVTPINDSFVDLDMLVRLGGDKMDVLHPSIYAEMVWEQKKHRAIRNKGSIDWIVIRNRLTNINSRNKEDMGRILDTLGRRIGFRVATGFGERVIFRELFLMGLTLLDLKKAKTSLTFSHLAAKQELRTLVKMIKLPQIAERTAVA